MLNFERLVDRVPGSQLGTRIRAHHFNELQQAAEDLQTGALPIALPGIEAALGAYAPLQNMRAGQLNALDESGVDPTGDADSYAGIQSAIDRAEDASASVTNTHGVDVVIPPGTYRLSQRLVVPHGVRVRGYGSRSTVLLADPSISTADDPACQY